MKIKSFLQYLLIVIVAITISNTNSAFAQKLELWYKEPATKWVEALPIGNGRLGAMVFGGIKDDHIQFNEETMWTGYPRDYNRQGAYKYLDSIRSLLFAGKQKEAEALAGREFMGLKSNSGNREAWINKVTAVLNQKNNPSQFEYNDAGWKSMPVPHYEGWETVGYQDMDGAVWFRHSFDLPEKWAGKDLKLDINKIADYDYTYVNGILIGKQENAEARDYTIPAKALRKGKNTIAILVLNFEKRGGIMGYKNTAEPIGVYPVGGDKNQKLSLNGQWKFWVQDANVPAVGEYQGAYLPFGDIHFSYNLNEAEVTDYKRSLDIANAIATTSYKYKGVSFRREYLASAPDQALAFRITADKKASVNLSAEFSSAHKSASVRKIDDRTIALTVGVKNGALKGESYLVVKTVGGNVSVKNNRLVITNADEALLYLTASTNFINYKTVSAQPSKAAFTALNKVKTKSWDQVKNAHVKEYHQYFNTFDIRFAGTNTMQNELPTNERLARFAQENDPAFVAIYMQYGRYLLISSSRPGTQPANLQGIWNDLLSPPWGSKYTTNINLEMNYWPAELLNLSPMHQPLFKMIRELSETGKETAKQYYNAPGWVLHHNTDLWRGTAPINASNHGIWVTGGAWLCDHLWEHYLFTQSKTFLKDTAYPLMKQAALFFDSYLIKDPKTGYLISTPSNSPEQGGLVAGPTMDHQIIRNLFKAVIDAADILNVDEALSQQLQDKYKRIAPNQIGRYGQLQEWMQDVDDTTNKHRHVSHLWAAYPGSEINWNETPDLMRAARQSLIYRGDEATGWSLGWKINLWARFKDAEHTYHMIKMLLSPAKGGAGSYPNLFDAHPPFQIDGNFGGAAGVGELLVQSHTKFIDLLPALPKALNSGSVKGLCVRGGFEIAMTWEQGRIKQITVLSKAGQALNLRYLDKTISINTKPNHSYTFNELLQQL